MKSNIDMPPLVSICCLTYNHSKYVRQCLDGFLRQETNFKYEIIIHDDCSTDGTIDIIKEYEQKYPSIIKPIIQNENQYSQGVRTILASFVWPKCEGKYIALCEGDDFWIAADKLQRQVDFLENNEDYGLCYTRVKQYIQKDNKFSKKNYGDKFLGFEDLLINGNCIPTLSVCCRKNIIDKYLQEIMPDTHNWLMGDYPMWLYFAHETKVKFFDFESGVYRVLENSASHTHNIEKQFLFIKCSYEIPSFFAEKYKIKFEKPADDYILFYCYVNELRMKYRKDYADELQKVYKKIKNPNIKCKIYNLFAHSNLFWKFMKFN